MSPTSCHCSTPHRSVDYTMRTKDRQGHGYLPVSVSTWGQGRTHNLNVPGALYPAESSLWADFAG